MHEKLIKQLRNSEHCGGCPYDKDCNDFDSCLLDLLAADAIEDMNKRIVRLEKESQTKSYQDNKRYHPEEIIHNWYKAYVTGAADFMNYLLAYNRSGQPLYESKMEDILVEFCKQFGEINEINI